MCSAPQRWLVMYICVVIVLETCMLSLFMSLAVENKILQHFLSFFSDDNDKPLSSFSHILMGMILNSLADAGRKVAHLILGSSGEISTYWASSLEGKAPRSIILHCRNCSNSQRFPTH
jgi:hypothetical protein